MCALTSVSTSYTTSHKGFIFFFKHTNTVCGKDEDFEETVQMTCVCSDGQKKKAQTEKSFAAVVQHEMTGNGHMQYHW